MMFCILIGTLIVFPIYGTRHKPKDLTLTVYQQSNKGWAGSEIREWQGLWRPVWINCTNEPAIIPYKV